MTTICKGCKEIKIPKDTKNKISYLKSKYNLNDLRITKDGTKYYEKCTTKTKMGFCSSHQKHKIDWSNLVYIKIDENGDESNEPCLILTNKFLTVLEKVLDNWNIEEVTQLKDQRKSKDMIIDDECGDKTGDEPFEDSDIEDSDIEDDKIKMKEIRTVDNAAYHIDNEKNIYKIDSNEKIGELIQVKYDKAPFCINGKFYICSIDRRLDGTFYSTCYLTNQVYDGSDKPIGIAHYSTRTREWVFKKKKF